MRMIHKNTFGSQNSRVDLQRQDLFKVTLVLPTALGLRWEDHVEFAIAKFPFPERSIETIAVKYMQQTNFLIGGDTPMPPVEVPVRYAFGQRTVEALEKWKWLTSNPVTGGVGLTSEVKTKGYFRWLVPNMRRMIQDLSGSPTPGTDVMVDGLVWELEGCMIKGFKAGEADHEQNGHVNCTFSLQIDRYYPRNIDQMTVNPYTT
jgi:hypothetical protein